MIGIHLGQGRKSESTRAIEEGTPDDERLPSWPDPCGSSLEFDAASDHGDPEFPDVGGAQSGKDSLQERSLRRRSSHDQRRRRRARYRHEGNETDTHQHEDSPRSHAPSLRPILESP
jgi:hypothetical protein